jgi:uncharacterized protein
VAASERHRPILEFGYAPIRRSWRKGPEIRAEISRIALKRGPIVYCLEAMDHQAPVHRTALPRRNRITASFEPDLLGGVGTLVAQAKAMRPAKDDALCSADPLETERVGLRAVPYHVWDHRDGGEMSVWIPEI